MTIFLIIGSVFAAVFLLCFVILYFISRRKDPVRLRLKDLTDQDGEKDAKTGVVSLKNATLVLGLDSEQARGTRLWLAQAGYRGPQSVFNYQGTRLIFATLLGMTSVAIGLYSHLDSALIPLLVFGGILVGGYVPKFWVAHKIVQRREQIRRSVPGVLDLMVVCVEAGLSLNAAIQKIATETQNAHRALCEELQLVNQEILIGKSRAEAFRNLARRTGADELRSLAVMLIQADKLGTSIADSLRVLADSLRVKRRQRAEEAAHKTSVKLVFPLVLLIFPELLVILVGPALINIVKSLSQVGQ